MKNLLITIFGILILFGCGNGNDINTIEESGTIEATNVVISSQVAGTILDIKVEEGGDVEKGDTLLIIDSEKYGFMLQQAEAAKTAAEAKLQLMKKGARKEDLEAAEQKQIQAKANFDRTGKDKQRFDELYKTGSVTQKQFDDISTAYEVAEAQFKAADAAYMKLKKLFRPEEIQQAQANLNAAESQLGLAEKNYKDCFVISPVSGTVVTSYMEEGETALPQSSLIKIANLKKMEIVIYVSEVDLGKVKLGQKAGINVDTYPDRTYEGKVKYISPEAEFTPKNIQTKDERTKLVFAVKLNVANPQLELKSGMPADVKIHLD